MVIETTGDDGAEFGVNRVPDFDVADIANETFGNHFLNLLIVGGGALLGSGKKERLGRADRLDHGLLLADVVAERFFAVDVLAGAEGFDRGDGVPVIGGADEDGINVLVFEKFPEIGVDLAGRCHRGPGLFGIGFVDVAEGDEVGMGGLPHEVADVLAAPAATDKADADSFISAIDSGGAGGGDG